MLSRTPTYYLDVDFFDFGHLDTKVQAKVEKVKDEGKLEVDVMCDKFKDLGWFSWMVD